MTDDRLIAERKKLAFHFDSSSSKLAGWTLHEEADRKDDEIVVRLMAGDMMLGRLRRDRERPDVAAHRRQSLPPCGFNVPDHGLKAFAALTGLDALAVIVESDSCQPQRHPLRELSRGEMAVTPLGARTGVGDSLRLGDVWLGSTRDFSLRFDGAAHVSRSIDAYQCTATGERRLIKVGADLAVGGFVTVVTMTLLNPFLPILLVYKGEDGAIDAIDLIPFPSLVRGGLHAGERLAIGHGGDDLADTANVSAQLLRAWLLKSEDARDHVTVIALDKAVHTGREPILVPDLLTWCSTVMNVSVALPAGTDVPVFIREIVEKFALTKQQAGHVLHLPADSVPTMSALVEPLPAGLPAQKVVGSMVVVDLKRHGRVYSVWQPAMKDWLDGLQLACGNQTAPLLEVRPTGPANTDAELAVQWPLSLALREIETRVPKEGPFEVSSELPVPLLLNKARPESAELCVVIQCQRNNQSIVPLLESLLRQECIGRLDIIVATPPGKMNAEVGHFLTSRLADRHVVVRQPLGRGRLEQLVGLRDQIGQDRVLIIDGDTILPDPRTLATMLPMLDGEAVETVGCLVRTGHGKHATQCAGYSPSGINLRGMPSFSFGLVDPAAFRQPATFPVVAGSMTVLLARRSTIERLDPRGSTSLRPEVDDLLFGMQVIEAAGLNLCTSIVSAFSFAMPLRDTGVGLSVPYRLAPESVARLTASSTIIQPLQ